MRKVWLGLLAAVTLAIVGGFATSANATELSASAATPGQFELCSTGSFLSYAYFPSLVDSNIPGLSFGDTAGVPAGSCVDIPLGNRNVQGYIYDGSADDVEAARLCGVGPSGAARRSPARRPTGPDSRSRSDVTTV